MATQKRYNYCIDFIKGIACIFVVFLHCEFPGTLGIAVQAISRYCVPFFFMVSGYYCYKSTPPISLENRLNKVKHILTITIYSSLFYILFALLQYWIWGDISLSISKKDLFAFVLFNQMKVIVSQMWFLYALLYVYIVFLWIGGKEWFKRYSLLITTVCLTLYVILAQGLHLAGISVPNFIYKNWLIEGIGFFSLGFVLHQRPKNNVSNSVLLIVFFSFTLLSLLERYLLGRDFGVNICSIPQVIALFLYGINNPNKHKGVLQKLGKTCSMFIYILHPFVWHSLERIYGAMQIYKNELAMYMMPILVLGITIILSIACYKVQSKVFNHSAQAC